MRSCRKDSLAKKARHAFPNESPEARQKERLTSEYRISQTVP